MGTLQERFDASYTLEPVTGCWLWNRWRNQDGYGRTQVAGKNVLAHRWSYTLHHGLIPAGRIVMHTCDVPACVNPAHLRAGTVQENVADRDQKGRRPPPKGAKNGRAKLTPSDVHEIRRLLTNGLPVRVCAKRYSVTGTTIRGIRDRRSWSHL